MTDYTIVFVPVPGWQPVQRDVIGERWRDSETASKHGVFTEPYCFVFLNVKMNNVLA